MAYYRSLKHKLRLKGKQNKLERQHMNMSARFAKSSWRKKKVTLGGLQ